MKKKIFYFSEQDKVVNFKIKKKKIDKNYCYIHKNIFYKFFAWLSFYFFALPIGFIYTKLIKQVKFKNKKVLKIVKTSFFVYANHTQHFLDGTNPALICFPKKPNIVVNSDNVFMPVLGKMVRMWGAVPLPDTISATKNFLNCLSYLISKNQPIIIYPEANLWPFYTNIRKFSDSAFRYPAEFNVPIFTFTTTYHKRKLRKTPKIIVFIDGPFYADQNLTLNQKKQELKNFAYNQMLKRAKLNTCEFIKYERRSND